MSCIECGGQTAEADGELACTTCGTVVMTVQRPRVVASSGSALLAYGSLGSYVGSRGAKGTATFLNGTRRDFGEIKRRADSIGRDRRLTELESLVQTVAGSLGLGHTATTEAVLVARHTYARSRKSGHKAPALSAHAILTALRRDGRQDVPTKRVIQAHHDLGRSLALRQLLAVEMDFPLPAPSKEDILTVGVRRLFAEKHDPRLIGSVLAEAKALLANFGESSRNPRTLAGVAIWRAGKRAGARISQREAATVVGVAEYTVREATAFYQAAGPQ